MFEDSKPAATIVTAKAELVPTGNFHDQVAATLARGINESNKIHAVANAEAQMLAAKGVEVGGKGI